MTFDPINDHVDQALNRLLEQYKESGNLKSIITAFTEQYQDMEDAGDDMNRLQFLDDAVGIQLDLFGTIVVLKRQGFDDDDYRRLLRVKIGQNISKGRPEQIMNIALLLTEATEVHYQNLTNAEISLSINTEIDALLKEFILENLQKMPSGGVRINYLACYDPDEPFSFDGTGPFGAGFSSLAAPATGGQFAFMHRSEVPFAFAQSTTEQGTDNALGFGAIADPYAGGVYVGL